jgi:hypothetical protein
LNQSGHSCPFASYRKRRIPPGLVGLLARMVPGATIRVMPGDFARLPAPILATAPGAGPAAIAGELPGRVRAELPAVGELGSGRFWRRRG